MNVVIIKLDSHDVGRFADLIRLFERTFDIVGFQLPSQSHLRHLLAQESFWAFVAEVENQVVGGLTAYVLPQYYTSQPQVYLYDIAVSEDCQRQGIGRLLLTELSTHCQSVEASLMYVQADGDDAGAIDFYRSTGGAPASVVQFTYLIDR